MRNLTIASFILLSISACIISCSTKRYTVSNAHSHNDYLNTTPFYNAYNEGFGSIEADVFPVNGELYVAHKKEDVRPGNTLNALYLYPLLSKLSTDSSRKLNLLVDVKENYKEALAILANQLKPLMRFLSTPAEKRNVTISISGERPVGKEFNQYPNYIFFDDNLSMEHSIDEWKRINLVSLPFDSISKWKGAGPIPSADIQGLKHAIDIAHKAGKPFRFWAAPDNTEAWKQQEKLGVDLIGTDKIGELGRFLKQRKNKM